jgi:hypothetical protein
MGRKGKDFYDRELSLATGTERLERVFQATVGGRTRTKD